MSLLDGSTLETEPRLPHWCRTGQKQCTLCRQDKPIADFYRNRSAYSTLSGCCRACTRAKMMLRYKLGKAAA